MYGVVENEVGNVTVAEPPDHGEAEVRVTLVVPACASVNVFVASTEPVAIRLPDAETSPVAAILPPELMLPPTPRPPVTFKAPVVDDEDAVELVIDTAVAVVAPRPVTVESVSASAVRYEPAGW